MCAVLLVASPALVARAAPPLRSLYTVQRVMRVCRSHLPAYPQSYGIEIVRGFYVQITSYVGPTELGILFDRPTTAGHAYRIHLVTVQEDPPEQTIRVQISRKGLVVEGPPHLVGVPSRPFLPDSRWVDVRGTLYCGNLAEQSSFFSGAQGKPFLGERSWTYAAVSAALTSWSTGG